MDTEKLKTFLVVAEQKSFSKAARLLYVSQPTISSQIKALEDELNTKLFERTTKKVNLTKSGEILFKYAREIIQLNDEARKEIMEMDHQVHGELQVGCSFTIGEYILPESLKRFKDEYPLIHMKVTITNSNNIISDIKNRKIDIGLIESPIDDPEVERQPFLGDELVLIAPPDYFAKPVVSISLDDLKELPLIIREKGSGTRKVVNHYLSQASISEDELNIVMEVGSTEAIKASVIAGLGVSILSKNAIKQEQKLNLLRAHKIKDISFQRHFYIVSQKHHVLKKTAELFIEEINKLKPKQMVYNEVQELA